MKKIRIAFVIDGINGHFSGTEKQLLETLRRLDRNRFEPTVLCLMQSDWQKENPLPVETVILGFKGFLKPSIFQFIQQYRLFLEKRKFDVVQTFFEEPIFLTFWATRGLKKRPVLLSSRRDIGLLKEPWYHALFKLIRPWVIRRYDGVLTNSSQVKQYVMKFDKAPDFKVDVIRNGITLNGFSSHPTLRVKKGKDEFWVGLVASVSPVKRHDVFFKALKRLKDKCPSLRFKGVLLGPRTDGPEVRALAQQCQVESDLHFVGPVPNVKDYLREFDVGVLCSDREGLSNSIIEYMSCSLPVVATAVGGTPELVDESNGICVPPGQPEALADGLADLATHKEKRSQLGAASRKKIEENYSWEKTMSQLERYYDDLLKKNKGA